VALEGPVVCVKDVVNGLDGAPQTAYMHVGTVRACIFWGCGVRSSMDACRSLTVLMKHQEPLPFGEFTNELYPSGDC